MIVGQIVFPSELPGAQLIEQTRFRVVCGQPVGLLATKALRIKSYQIIYEACLWVSIAVASEMLALQSMSWTVLVATML